MMGERCYTATPVVPSKQLWPGSGSKFIGDTVTEEYSYTQPGQVTGKRMQLARQPSGSPQPPALILNLDATWNYTTYNEGHLMGVTYPGIRTDQPVLQLHLRWHGTAEYHDGRQQNTLVSGTTYNAAGQMLTGVDIRTYNSMGQLASITSEIRCTSPTPIRAPPEQWQGLVAAR